MKVTRVDIELSHDGPVKAYCSVVLDDMLCIRSIRLVQKHDRIIIAMPSKKGQVRCPRCYVKSPYNARFCSDCGLQLPLQEAQPFYLDIVFPVTSEMREYLNQEILRVYYETLQNEDLKGGESAFSC